MEGSKGLKFNNIMGNEMTIETKIVNYLGQRFEVPLWAKFIECDRFSEVWVFDNYPNPKLAGCVGEHLANYPAEPC